MFHISVRGRIKSKPPYGGDLMSEMEEEMTVAEKKEYGKWQKEHLINLILEYQKEGPDKYTLKSLRGKTLRQIERIFSRECI